MIRAATEEDFAAIWRIIEDASRAYRGVIPADRWHEPYMSEEELRAEIAAGVAFWLWEEAGSSAGVMGMQDRGEVELIRHAYVRTGRQGEGIGSELLRFLEARTAKPILVGTWAAARWAVEFYRKHGYRLLDTGEKDALLRRFWSIPERQVETSVVLANPRWQGP